MNYYVPPQGLPGLVQVPQMVPQVQIPQMVGAASPQMHMLAHMPAAAHQYQPAQAAAMVNPTSYARVMSAAPSYAAQQVNANYAAAAAAAQMQAARQQAAHRAAANSAAVSRVVLTPKTPPAIVQMKKETVDAEVQTPETDASPEADSSTKARIMTSILACCSAVVSSDYRHLQSRILTWGEQNERQALEITRVKADLISREACPVPMTMAAVLILDDGQLQFQVSGKPKETTSITEKEDIQLDGQKLREYLDFLGDSYSFCWGFSDDDLQNVPSLDKHANSLVRVVEPFERAVSVNCTQWCKVIAGSSEQGVRCPECTLVMGQISKNKLPGSGKRQARLCLEDLATEPEAKKPRLSDSARQELDQIRKQVEKFRSSESSQNPKVVGKFLDGLEHDIEQVVGACSVEMEEKEEATEVQEEEEEIDEESLLKEDSSEANDQSEGNPPINDECGEAEEKPKEAESEDVVKDESDEVLQNGEPEEQEPEKNTQDLKAEEKEEEVTEEEEVVKEEEQEEQEEQEQEGDKVVKALDEAEAEAGEEAE